jgi:hypothetical protein
MRSLAAVYSKGVQSVAGVIAGFAIVPDLSKMSNLDGGVLSSSKKEKKPPKAPRVDKSSQSI